MNARSLIRYDIRSLLLVVLLGLVVATGLLRPSWRIGGDGFWYHAYWRSVAFDGDLDFANERREFIAQFGDTFVPKNSTPVGRVPNYFGVGPAILWTPALTIAVVIDGASGGAGAGMDGLGGYSKPYRLAVALSTWVYALAGLGFIFTALRRLVRPAAAWWATIAAAALSPLPHYLLYEPFGSHGLTVLATGLQVYFAVRFARGEWRELRWVVLAGALAGAAFLLRFQDLLYGLAPVLLWVLVNRRDSWRRVAAGFAAAGAAAVLVAVPQLVIWHQVFGSAVTIPQGPSFFDFTNPHILESLFSGWHGLFAIHPLLLLAAVGLGLAVRRWRLLALVGIAVLTIQIILNGCLSDWVGGAAFGQRRTISGLGWWALGFVALFSLAQRTAWRRVLITLCLVGAIWSGLLMLSYARGVLPLFGETTLKQVYSAPFQLR